MSNGGRGAACVGAALLGACMLASLSCSSLHVAAGIPPLKTDKFVSDTRDGVTVEAHALETLEEYWDTFDDNLPELGIVAVWVIVRNRQDSGVTLDGCEWRLRAGSRAYGSLGADALLKQYHKNRGIRALTVHAAMRAESRLESVMLGAARIAPEQSGEGFVFFRTVASPSGKWIKDCRLVVRGIRTSGAALDFDMPLAYAHP